MGVAESLTASATRCGTVCVGSDNEGVVVSLRGEHDISTTAELSITMARAISLDDANVVIDMSAVDFIGADVVDLIVRAREFLRLRTRSMVVRDPSRPARRILDLYTGVVDIAPLAITMTVGSRRPTWTRLRGA